MHSSIIFLPENFEEIEALTVLDILRRGELNIQSVSLTDSLWVTGSHAITVKADCLYADLASHPVSSDSLLVLPGGPGHVHYRQHQPLLDLLTAHHQSGGRIAAICAAPSVLGRLGILNGKTAVCYPSFEESLTGAIIGSRPVETDGNITTSQSAATALPFALELLRLLKGADTADAVGRQILYGG